MEGGRAPDGGDRPLGAPRMSAVLLVKVQYGGLAFLPGKRVRIRLASKTKERFIKKVRELTNRTRPLAMSERVQQRNEYLGGWLGYFRLAEAPSVFQAMDEWLRRRLRMCLWKQWKRPKTRYRERRRLGLKAACPRRSRHASRAMASSAYSSDAQSPRTCLLASPRAQESEGKLRIGSECS